MLFVRARGRLRSIGQENSTGGATVGTPARVVLVFYFANKCSSKKEGGVLREVVKGWRGGWVKAQSRL